MALGERVAIMVIGFISLCVLMAAAVLLVILIRRNNDVFEFKSQLLDALVTRIGKGDFDEYILEYESVSYDRMLLIFWRPLKSFYRVTKLLTLLEFIDVLIEIENQIVVAVASQVCDAKIRTDISRIGR